jgi:hypothetical protein
MWTRAFLTVGLASGFATAAGALATLWLALFALTNSSDPNFTPANIVQLCAPGVLTYPACWYTLIFRKKTYSVRNTVMLVVITFLVLWILLAAAMFAGGVHVSATIIAEAAELGIVVLIAAAAAPVAYVLTTVIGAVFLVVPYAAIAFPAAFAHRWVMLRLFRAPTAAGTLPV